MAPSTSHLVDLIDRYKKQHPETTDAAIARSLRMTPANLSLWRSKGVRGWPARSTLDALAATTGRPYREVLDAALADTGYTPPAAVSSPRSYAEVLVDAIAALSEATRLTNYAVRQNPSGEWEPDPDRPVPIDWAEFVCDALAGAAANAGGIEAALSGRPGSWEASTVREVLVAAVGEDGSAELWRHRTEPLHVVIDPERVLADIDSSWFADERADDEELIRRENAVRPSYVYSYPGHELDDRMRAYYARLDYTIIDGTPPLTTACPTAEEVEAALAAERKNPTELTPDEQAEEDALDDLALLRDRLAEERGEELAAYGAQLAAIVRDHLDTTLHGLTTPIIVTVADDTSTEAFTAAPRTEVVDAAIAAAAAAVTDPAASPGTPLTRLEDGTGIVQR